MTHCSLLWRCLFRPCFTLWIVARLSRLGPLRGSGKAFRHPGALWRDDDRRRKKRNFGLVQLRSGLRRPRLMKTLRWSRQAAVRRGLDLEASVAWPTSAGRIVVTDLRNGVERTATIDRGSYV